MPVTSAHVTVSRLVMNSAQPAVSSLVSVQRPSNSMIATSATATETTSAAVTNQRQRITSVQSDEPSQVSIHRPDNFLQVPPITTNVRTSTRATEHPERMATTSLQMLSTSKVNEYLSDLNLSPLHDRIEDTPLSSTLRRDDLATGLDRNVETKPILTAAPGLVQAQQNRHGDANRNVGFREPVSNIIARTPQSINQLDPTAQLASAIQMLASTNEVTQLPKSELMTFTGCAKDYKRFITNFTVNVGSLSITAQRKLSYLIQYCTGEARSLIEDCVMLDPEEGFVEALRLLKNEYGKPQNCTFLH